MKSRAPRLVSCRRAVRRVWSPLIRRALHSRTPHVRSSVQRVEEGRYAPFAWNSACFSSICSLLARILLSCSLTACSFRRKLSVSIRTRSWDSSTRRHSARMPSISSWYSRRSFSSSAPTRMALQYHTDRDEHDTTLTQHLRLVRRLDVMGHLLNPVTVHRPCDRLRLARNADPAHAVPLLQAAPPADDGAMLMFLVFVDSRQSIRRGRHLWRGARGGFPGRRRGCRAGGSMGQVKHSSHGRVTKLGGRGQRAVLWRDRPGACAVRDG